MTMRHLLLRRLPQTLLVAVGVGRVVAAEVADNVARLTTAT